MLPVGCSAPKDADGTVWRKSPEIEKKKYQEAFNEKTKNCVYPQRKPVAAVLEVEGKEYTVMAYARSGPGDDDYYIDRKYYKVYVKDKIFYSRLVKHYANDNDLHIRSIDGTSNVVVRGDYIIETKLAKFINEEDFQKKVEEAKKQYDADLKAYEDCLEKSMPELPKELYHRMSRYDY